MKPQSRQPYFLIDVASLDVLNEANITPSAAADFNRLLAPVRPKRRWVTKKSLTDRQAKRAVEGH